MHEIRLNPLVKWWIIVAEHRSMRPWRPDETAREVKCPFCPGAPELAHLDKWDVVVLPNKYPALVEEPERPKSPGFEAYEVKEARGACKVIVETPSHEGDFYTLSLDHVVKVIEAYSSEYAELSKREYVEYVAVFRNKGKEIGVSLTHPHSQIYALPFIPPRILAELDSMKEYYEKHGKCLICDVVAYETGGERVVYENEHFLVLLPFYAMWPYELHVYPKRHFSSILDLRGEEVVHFADTLRVVTATYTELLERDAPYIMALHNPPTKGNYPYYHFHVEFYQPYREKGKLKYAAGIEWGYWVFTYDGSPEAKARELRASCAKAVQKLGEVLGKCK
ncbi:MAG: galactose-1-phosphate uridylyltransferase [Desulfurococcaceae archaeon]